MDYTSLVSALLPAIAKYGPDLVHQVVELFRGNPQQQGETDDAYITRINAQIDAKLSDAAAKDSQVEAS